MNKITGIVGVLVVAVGGYFGGQAMGLFGGAKAMSAEEVSAYLETYAAEINGAGENGLEYDGHSNLVTATHIEKQITIRGNSERNLDQLSDTYMESREGQAANKICNDENARAALDGGAKFVFNWFSADDEHLGMLTIRNRPDPFCEKHGY